MQSLAQAGRVLSAFRTVPSGGFALRSNTGMGRVLPVADAFADGRLSSCLRPLARRTAGMRGTAAGGDMIGRERWQAGPGHDQSWWQLNSLTQSRPSFDSRGATNSSLDSR